MVIIIPIKYGVKDKSNFFRFFWLGELGGEHLTLYVSMWLVMVGLCWMHFGFKKLIIIGFPLFFILTRRGAPAESKKLKAQS
jgi:hypothetical protein